MKFLERLAAGLHLTRQPPQRLHHPHYTRPGQAPLKWPEPHRANPRPPSGVLDALVAMPIRAAGGSRSIATQTSPADFAPAAASHALPVRFAQYGPADLFAADIELARERYGHAVAFTPVRGNGMTLGYLMSPRQAGIDRCEPNAAALFVAGNGKRSELHPHVATGSQIALVRTRPTRAALLETARQVRRAEVDPAEVIAELHPHFPAPNLTLDSRALPPLDAAAFVYNTGHNPGHRQPVDVFVPVPDAVVHLSTLERQLGAGNRYGTIVYAQP